MAVILCAFHHLDLLFAPSLCLAALVSCWIDKAYLKRGLVPPSARRPELDVEGYRERAGRLELRGRC